MIVRALVLVLVAAALSAGTTASGADFVATTATPGNTFATAADFNTVTATLADPGTPLHGTVTLAATASSERGIATVRIQAAPSGTQDWRDLCTASAAPYACRWDSTTIASGTWDLRALATDAAGYRRASAIVASRVVDNAGPSVTLDDPGVLSGTPTITASATDTGTGVATLAIEYSRPGDSSWTQLCTGSGTPRSCTLDTTGMSDGALQLRAVATDTVGNGRASTTVTRLIDNSVPAVAASDPGALVHGNAGVTVTASDSGSGIASVTVDIRLQGTTTWYTACTLTTPPFTCSGDTHQLPDGVYEVRATATDMGGLKTIAATGVSRVDNTAPSAATLADPGGPATGTVHLSGTAADAGAGIASWRVEYAPANTTTWHTACTATASPYACDWDTTKAGDGTYDLRAVATDAAGNVKASATRAGVRVDDSGPAVTFAGPGSPVRGAVALGASANDPSGVASLAFEIASAGSGNWTQVCQAATTAPYGCTWDTTGLDDGYYDVRVVARDALGLVSRTPLPSAVHVDNTTPVGG